MEQVLKGKGQPYSILWTLLIFPIFPTVGEIIDDHFKKKIIFDYVSKQFVLNWEKTTTVEEFKNLMISVNPELKKREFDLAWDLHGTTIRCLNSQNTLESYGFTPDEVPSNIRPMTKLDWANECLKESKKIASEYLLILLASQSKSLFSDSCLTITKKPKRVDRRTPKMKLRIRYSYRIY